MANIYVAVLVLKLEMPWVKSLKEKRSLVVPLSEKLKARFPLSVARIDGLNEHIWEVIALSSLSHDEAWLEDLMNKAENFSHAHAACTLKRLALDIDIWLNTQELLM